jgi:hypothetical protein
VTYPPKVSVSRLVNSLKGFSARLIRKKHYPSILKKLWGTSLWSPSYFPGSCGGASISIIRQYIEQQNTPLQDSSAVRSLYLRPKKRGFTEHSDKPAKLARSLPGCVARFGRNGKRFFDEHWAAFQIPPASLVPFSRNPDIRQDHERHFLRFAGFLNSPRFACQAVRTGFDGTAWRLSGFPAIFCVRTRPAFPPDARMV